MELGNVLELFGKLYFLDFLFTKPLSPMQVIMVEVVAEIGELGNELY